jgi:hypothetical protein
MRGVSGSGAAQRRSCWFLHDGERELLWFSSVRLAESIVRLVVVAVPVPVGVHIFTQGMFCQNFYVTYIFIKEPPQA